MQNPFLIGTKIYLRPLEKEDAPSLRTWINDPDVRCTLNMYRPMNLRDEEEFIARATESEHDLALGIVIKHGDKLIGAAGLHRMDFKNRHASFGISIGDKTEWSRGYGTEATHLMVKHGFETLNFNRIWLYVFEYNARGMRAYEKVGFKREGILRQDRYHEGRYENTILMAILREEWAASKQQTS
ncbi:MAG TPA: GNAT family protein [Gemmataceae bacterium]|jgi:RimJ/RimL family protein N-acetyltransferase|nr:GNAT family protein [Gemmataceae bacterium]